jgi:hypothetical protein
MMPPGGVRRVRHTYENQALHLGTYETAIESMLRRMRDQDEGERSSTFTALPCVATS